MIMDLRGKRDPGTFATSLGRRRRTGEISQFRPRPQTKKVPFFTNLINKNAKKQKHSLILIKRVYQEKTVDSPSAHMKKKTLRIAQETQESIFQPPSHDSVYLVEERQPHRNRD
jgi:hypothetical protein